MKYIFSSLLLGILASVFLRWWVSFAQWTSADGQPCVKGEDIMLNTDIPFIWRCIKKDTNAVIGGQTTLGNAFPKLMWWLIRVVMAAVVIVGFLAILVWGFMVAAEGAASTKQKGLELIKLAIAWLILVGTSGIILNLINPNFFKTYTWDQWPVEWTQSNPDDMAGWEDESGEAPDYGDTA